MFRTSPTPTTPTKSNTQVQVPRKKIAMRAYEKWCKRGRKHDQFAAELVYFSDCILDDRQPEPSGEEGLRDVRIIQALYESAESGKVVALAPIAVDKRPTGRQRITRPGVKKPELVHAQSASR